VIQKISYFFFGGMVFMSSMLEQGIMAGVVKSNVGTSADAVSHYYFLQAVFKV